MKPGEQPTPLIAENSKIWRPGPTSFNRLPSSPLVAALPIESTLSILSTPANPATEPSPIRSIIAVAFPIRSNGG